MTYQIIIVGISKYFSQYMYSIYTTYTWHNTSLHGDCYTGMKMQMWCSNNIQFIRPQHRLILVERKVVTASFVLGHAVSFFFFEEPRSKGQNEV